MSNIASYLTRRLNAKNVKVSSYFDMNNHVRITFIINDIEYVIYLPRYNSDSYYDDYFSTNYPELLL